MTGHGQAQKFITASGQPHPLSDILIAGFAPAAMPCRKNGAFGQSPRQKPQNKIKKASYSIVYNTFIFNGTVHAYETVTTPVSRSRASHCEKPDFDSAVKDAAGQAGRPEAVVS
jgi:hypothetical protein